MTIRPVTTLSQVYSFMTLAFAFLLVALCACSSVEETRLQRSISESITQQIQEFNSADARTVVAGRLKEGNLKFLSFTGQAKEPSFLPGLSQRETQQLIDTKKYQSEVFYYYHGRSELGSPSEQKALWNARLNYAERVNRELLEQIGKPRLVN
jgi:hypothetical protein